MNDQKPTLKDHNFLGTAWGDKDSPRFLSIEDKRRHILVTGAPGTGKSTLLLNLFSQEVNNGRGVMLIDGHGDLARDAIGVISPTHRRKTIYFNASDTEYPVGFNILGNVPRALQARRVADIVEAFRSLWADSWGPRLNHILLFTLSALIEQGDATLLCISRMLMDAKYRKQVLARVTDHKTLEFWRDTFPLYSDQGPEVFTPILNKIDALLASPEVRNILVNPHSAFDPRHMIDNKYIIVANLSGLGAEPANLLGSLLISSFATAAKSRENLPQNERRPFTLIIDEFTNYQTEQFKSLLSEARKFNLSLVLAHQYLDQIENDDIRHAVLGAVGTYIMFRVSGADAEKFARGPMPDYPPESYVGTPNYQTWCRLLQYGTPSQTFQLHVPRPPKTQREPGKTIEHSRHQWATPREKIQDRIDRFLSGVPEHGKEVRAQPLRKWDRR